MCLPITFMNVNSLYMVRSGVGNMECLALKDVVGTSLEVTLFLLQSPIYTLEPCSFCSDDSISTQKQSSYSTKNCNTKHRLMKMTWLPLIIYTSVVANYVIIKHVICFPFSNWGPLMNRNPFI